MFTLGDKTGGLNPLPIELLYFNAQPDGNLVALNWSTASEFNNNHFEVERSDNAISFTNIASVNAYGDGNNNSIQLYSTIDNASRNNIIYYRLKQIDNDGKSKYSEIKSVNFISKHILTVYPNPTCNNLTVDTGESFQNTDAKIIDVLGNEILFFTLHSSINQINVSSLESGQYYLVIDSKEATSNNRFQKTKIVIQK